MTPIAFTIPAALPPGVFGALFEPTGLAGLAAAMAAAVSIGICVALASRRPAPRATATVDRAPAFA